jgi:hypothetical protein
MVAMSVLVIALTGVAGMTAHAGRRSVTLAGSAGRTAVQTQIVDQLMVHPFTTLASKAGCTTVTTAPYPHARCVTVTDLSADRRQVTVIFSPANPYLRPDTLRFERSRSMAGSPLH